jgi:DNA polymerase-1
MSKPRLFLIDAMAFCYRAFYAIGGLSTSFGQPTNAIYGFLNILNKILKEQKPGYIAACFDVSRDTFRARKFAEYKIQRPPMPDGLTSQIPLIKEIISAYGITILEKSGYEADDIIATVAKKAGKEGMPVTIVTSDKDMLQLVDEHTVVFNPYKEGGVVYDSAKVQERFGVTAGQIPDIIALMGDESDNIPGAHGIGEKTAVALIKSGGSIEKLLAHINEIKQEKLKEIVSNNTEIIKLSKELALLECQANIDFNLDDFKAVEPNYKELFRLFKYLEFRKLLKELPVQEEARPEIIAAELDDHALEAGAILAGELFLCGTSREDLMFCYNNKFFRVKQFGEQIKSILANPAVKKISHDLKKLKVSLAGEHIILEGLYFDTMLASYLINPSTGAYSLADISLHYLEQGALPEVIDNSRGLDCIVKLKPKLEKELVDKNLVSLFNDIEMPLVEVLAEMELKGIKVDVKLLKDLSGDLEKRLIALIEEIYALSGTQFNINSPKQLREILFERLKLPVGRKSKTGPSTDEEVLRKLSKTHALPGLLLEYRQLTKLKTTYVDALPALIDPATGRIHTSFNQAATETGRLSSSNPNLQNLPVKTEIGSKIRQSVIPFDKDNYLLSCDYSQVELRILAHLSKDDNLINAFKQDKDIHKATAALIFGTEEKDVTDQMREVSKRVNFGIVYGLSAYGLAKDLNIPMNEAQAFIDSYFLRYPKVKEYIEAQIKKAEKDGFVTTILGRRRYLPEIKSKNQSIRQLAERQSVNTPIQGSASDLIKLAMIKIHDRIKRKNFKSSMLLQIHDELVFDVPSRECDEFSSLVKDIMENVLALDVPIRVNIKKGKNWLETEPA